MQDKDRPTDLLPREFHGLPRACLNDAAETPPKLVWPLLGRYQLSTGTECSSLWGFLAASIKRFFDHTELQYESTCEFALQVSTPPLVNHNNTRNKVTNHLTKERWLISISMNTEHHHSHKESSAVEVTVLGTQIRRFLNCTGNGFLL